MFDRIFIFGASGFIGSDLYDHLDQQNIGTIVPLSSKVCDLTNPSQIEKFSNNFSPESAIVFLSAIKRQRDSGLDALNANIKMATNLLKALQSHPVRHILYLSSTAVYGEDQAQESITEDSKISLRSHYGVAKYAIESLFQIYQEQNPDCTIQILRPSTVYGPKDYLYPYGPSYFLNAALNREKVVLWGDASEKRDFLFVHDLSRIIASMLSRPESQLLNVATGASTSFRDVLTVIENELQTEIHSSTRARTKNQVDHFYNVENLRKTMPEFSFTGLQEGIRTMLENLRHLKK
jgi:nucleoside-diphosphate-sugar epimerase